MKTKLIRSNLDQWHLKRSHLKQFCASDEEVQRWMLDALPQNYKPYYLIGFDTIKSESVGHYVQSPFVFGIDELKKCMRKGQRQRYIFYICPSLLWPLLQLKEGDRVDTICSYNGLLRLVHGLRIRKVVNPDKRKSDERLSKELYSDSSDISVIYAMENELTGEVRHYDESLEIYNSLKRAITRELKYTSIHHFLGGPSHEDTSLVLFTEGARQNYLNGELYLQEPGRPLKEAKAEKKKLRDSNKKKS